MASSMEADISTFTKISTLEATSVAVYLYVITIEAVTLITPKIQLYPDPGSWRLPNMYPESCDCGLPDHGPVDWSRGLTSSDWPRGLAGSRGWFRCLSPWNHKTIESDLPLRVHRSGHELFPRIKLKVRAIKYEAYFDPNFSNICSQRYRW